MQIRIATAPRNDGTWLALIKRGIGLKSVPEAEDAALRRCNLATASIGHESYLVVGLRPRTDSLGNRPVPRQGRRRIYEQLESS